MKKIQKTTKIFLPRGNKTECPIYEHEGKFYIKANKPNTKAYTPFIFEGIEYAEVIKIENSWFKK